MSFTADAGCVTSCSTVVAQRVVVTVAVRWAVMATFAPMEVMAMTVFLLFVLQAQRTSTSLHRQCG